MLAINTINDFYNLTPLQQKDILEGVRIKDKLDAYLESRNVRKAAQSFSAPCDKCGGTGIFTHEERLDADTDYHASSISGCIRKIYYDVTGHRHLAEPKNNANSHRTLDMGNAIHDLIQSYGNKGAFCNPGDYQDEVPIVPSKIEAIQKAYHDLPVAQEYKLRSHVDAIVWSTIVEVQGIGPVSVRTLHEYKTIGEKGFDFLTGPKKEHREQTAIYNMVFDMPITVFLYWCTANADIRDYTWAVNFDDWRYVENKIKTIESYKAKGEPPPFEISSAKLNNIECTGDGNRFSSCKYYGSVCHPPKELLKVGARKRGK